MRKLVFLPAGLMLLYGGSTFGQSASDGFPPGSGHDTFVRVCSGCHDLNLVSDKRLDRAGWHKMVQRMIDLGAAVNETEAEEVVTYLDHNYAAK